MTAADLTGTVAEYVAATKAADIPESVRNRTRQILLDELASGYFGAGRPAGLRVGSYVAGQHGRPEAVVLGRGLRTSAALAALANGTAGHADEIDGAHVVGGHPGATLVHAATAIAQQRHSSGADLVTAIVLGYDIGVRVLEACGGLFAMKSRHLHGDFLYAVGAAVACARLAGLDVDRTRHAIALSTFGANGLCALFREHDHLSKAFCNGQYASAGVTAALLSESGLEGVPDVLGERHGLLDAWGTDDGAERLLHDLGTRFAVEGANFKFLRAGYPIHAPVEAALALMADHGLGLDQIDSVRVGMPENAMRVVDARTMHDICLQDMLAVALVRGRISLSESAFPEIESEPAYLRVRERIVLGVDPDLQREQPNGRGAVVTIALSGGGSVSRRVDHPLGHSMRGGPTWTELAGKWRDALPGADTTSWVAAVHDIEDVEDVTGVLDLFLAPRPVAQTVDEPTLRP